MDSVAQCQAPLRKRNALPSSEDFPWHTHSQVLVELVRMPDGLDTPASPALVGVLRDCPGAERIPVAESARAHSYYFSKEVHKSCEFWLLTIWLLTVWLLTVPSCSM